ncbi:MAG: hypothetical protein WCG09_00720 [Halobacteriota archaeon]|jgi:hypothetical protein
MWEDPEGGPGMGHGMGKGRGMMMMWEKLDDNAKKMLATRMLDERILKKELKIKLLEHKVETLKMMKTWVEKM